MKPSLYLDTNVISSLYYQGGGVLGGARLAVMEDWWAFESRHYDIRASRILLDELADGKYSGQDKAIAASKRLNFLPLTGLVKQCAKLLIEEGFVPAAQLGDAYHLAFCIGHRVDYLMTWNYAHLANPELQRRLEEMCMKHAWRPPVIVSPESIHRVSLGQEIRRTE
jgi:hypothetical protein